MEQQVILRKIEHLEQAVQSLQERRELQLSDEAALIFLKSEIQQLKNEGVKHVDVISIHERTRLPLSQIAKLMRQIEREGVVGACE